MSTDVEFLEDLSSEAPVNPPPPLISEYIQGRRILPAGSPRPGPIDIFYAPFMVEIMDNMGPYSGVNRTSVMKGVQITATTGSAENPIAYYMDASPAEIMYCSGTTDLLEKWTKRLEPLIDSCGFRHKISAQVENTKSRKTGDKMYSKEYSGGSLSMVSLQAPAAMRSESNRILIVDEVDSAPPKTVTGEGNFLGVLEGRTAAYGSNYKIMELSTPTTFELSVIKKQFEAGDERYYNVPCPRCGCMIVLKFEQLMPEYNVNGHLENVYYECQECKDRIDNHEKTWMMNIERAEWIATSIPREPTHRSYHISAMYSPVGMLSWKRIYQFFLNAQEDPDLLPSFRNLYQGLPYKETGSRPDHKKIKEKVGTYKDGTVPDGVIFLTMAGDIQLGAEIYQKMAPEVLEQAINKIRAERGELALWKSKIPRIELEVYGEGLGYRSWSVDYKVFYGHTTLGAYEGAFEEVYQWFEETKLVYTRADGVKFNPKIASFDASEGKTSPTVFEFCERFGANVFPNINSGWLKQKKDKGLDEEAVRDFDRFRWSKKEKHGGTYLSIATNPYKKILYSRLNIPRDNIGMQPPGFCDFPLDRSGHYFKMLTAEDQLVGGAFYRSESTPAEALDCRVYNLCIADVWLEGQVKKARENAVKSKRYAESEIKKIDKKYILRRLDEGLR